MPSRRHFNGWLPWVARITLPASFLASSWFKLQFLLDSHGHADQHRGELFPARLHIAAMALELAVAIILWVRPAPAMCMIIIWASFLIGVNVVLVATGNDSVPCHCLGWIEMPVMTRIAGASGMLLLATVSVARHTEP